MGTYNVPEHMESLLHTFTEMMTGEATPERVEIVLQWALYMHMRSAMPPMVAHWSQTNPEEAAIVKTAMQQLQSWNEQWKAARQNKQTQKEE